MMKKILLGAAALAAMAAPAFAADMPPRPYTKAPAYTAPQVVYNWTGFYVGGTIYSDWASVPSRFKSNFTQDPDASRSSASMFSSTIGSIEASVEASFK